MLKTEKITFNDCEVRKRSIRLWSPMRWSKSPIILVSKKTNRHFHQLNQEIGDDTYINTCADVKQYPRPNEIDGHAADKKHHLCSQHQINEINILRVDTDVQQYFESETERSAGLNSLPKINYQLGNKLPVRFQVFEQKFKIASVRFLTFQVKEFGCRVKQ